MSTGINGSDSEFLRLQKMLEQQGVRSTGSKNEPDSNTENSQLPAAGNSYQGVQVNCDLSTQVRAMTGSYNPASFLGGSNTGVLPVSEMNNSGASTTSTSVQVSVHISVATGTNSPTGTVPNNANRSIQNDVLSKVSSKFDADGNGILDAKERSNAEQIIDTVADNIVNDEVSDDAKAAYDEAVKDKNVIKAFDENGNGKLDGSELATFAVYAADEDGNLTASSIAKAVDKIGAISSDTGENGVDDGVASDDVYNPQFPEEADMLDKKEKMDTAYGEYEDAIDNNASSELSEEYKQAKAKVDQDKSILEEKDQAIEQKDQEISEQDATVLEKQNLVSDATKDVGICQQAVTNAQNALSDAQNIPVGEDGDTSSRDAAVAEAQRVLEDVQTKLEQAQERLDQAKNDLETEKNKLKDLQDDKTNLEQDKQDFVDGQYATDKAKLDEIEQELANNETIKSFQDTYKDAKDDFDVAKGKYDTAVKEKGQKKGA